MHRTHHLLKLSHQEKSAASFCVIYKNRQTTVIKCIRNCDYHFGFSNASTFLAGKNYFNFVIIRKACSMKISNLSQQHKRNLSV